LQGSYDLRLVALSIGLAAVAAYAALDLAGRVTASHHAARCSWLAGGAVAMGSGIWAMHYIGMVAFVLPVPVVYHYPTVALSLVAAILASAVALFTASRKSMGPASALVGSLVMGVGIAAMHYLGMRAMRLQAVMEYRWGIVALSLALGIAASYAALKLSFLSREEKTSQRKFLRAVFMGCGISLMHYTGMWAVRFRSSAMPESTQSTMQLSSLLTGVISVTTLLILLLAIVVAFLDRRFSLQSAATESARDAEAHFRLLSEAIPQIVWTATAQGSVDYVNHRIFELTGLSQEVVLGEGWLNILHPDDRTLAIDKWRSALQNGVAYQMEYRLRNVAGLYCWHQVRATPLLDSSGTVVKWFGACTDIDDQMHYQQLLEEQVKEHTQALMEANLRLEEEMRERSLAQQELNGQNERMVQELTLRSQRATNLVKMAELLQSCTDTKDAFSVVAGMAPKIFPELRGAVLLFNSSRSVLETAVSWSDCVLPSAVFSPQDCWGLRTGRLHTVTPGDTTAECKHVVPGQSSYFCVPLLSQGEAIGVLHFQMIETVPLAETIMSMVSMFAEQVGLSVTNLRLREALRNQSIRDPLTGLFNRRYLEEMLDREIRRAVRSEQSLGLLMLDLDFFKKFNDTYGHEAGDTVLREVGSFLSRSVRAEDVVCRFGGEEFVIILPMADLKATRARAERIRSKLRELPVLHQGQSVGMVTVSIGVSAVPQHGTSRNSLLDAADAALYQAKREGRDRVAVAAFPPPVDEAAALLERST